MTNARKKYTFWVYVVVHMLILSRLCVGSLGVISTSKHITNDVLQFDIIYKEPKTSKKRTFRYIDKYTQAPNHIIQQDFVRRGINATTSQKIAILQQLHKQGYTAEQALNCVLPKVFETIDKVERALYARPVDSKVKFVPNSQNMFIIKPQVHGRQLDRDLLIRDIYQALLDSQLNCNAYVQELYPNIDQRYNKQATYYRSGYSTDYSSSSDNRKHNIALSLSKINGTVIGPGQTFSFNKVVGARTIKTGYRESKIILHGKFVEGVGGGVCQVSTTLYNAALRADMCIVSVRNHSLPVGYVPPSLDAMVNSNTTDLKFENTTTHPIYIRAYSSNNRAIIEFYGLPMLYRIEPESEIVDSIPPPILDEIIVDNDYKYMPPDTPSGQTVQVNYSKGGLSSRAYLCYYDHYGNLVSRRHIRTDKYKAQQGLIAVAP
ncbi:MAG: VanW family protein [Clostridiales bacterium]|jgi:vancomycin resistance protein YoaR|nr:VanW family protein [Clostridiales bacterium]